MFINCNTIKLEHFHVPTVGETKQIQAIQQQILLQEQVKTLIRRTSLKKDPELKIYHAKSLCTQSHMSQTRYAVQSELHLLGFPNFHLNHAASLDGPEDIKIIF